VVRLRPVGSQQGASRRDGAEHEAPAQARLLREGDETRASVLIEGRVALTEHVAGRGSVDSDDRRARDVFGWSASITPYRATSSVISLEPVRIGLRCRPRCASARSDCELTAGIYPKLLEALARRLDATRHQLPRFLASEQTEPW
jgi:hypothetical protein